MPNNSASANATPQSPPHPRSSILIILLQIEAWALLAFMLIKYVAIQQFTTLGVDFPKHYWAAIEVLNGQNPFDGDLYLGFNYPLFTAWIYLFLAPFSLKTAGLLWDICNTLYVMGSFTLILFCYRPKPNPQSPPYLLRLARYWPSIAAFAFAIYAPIFLEIRDGNIEPLNLFLLVALGASLLHGQEKTAGILLAMLCLVKILPIFFLLALFLGGKRRTIYACLISIAAYGLILLLTGWWRWEWYLFTQTLPNVGYHYRGLSNSLVAQSGFYLLPNIMHSPRAFSIAAAAIAIAILTISSLVLLTTSLRSRRSSLPELQSPLSTSPLLRSSFTIHHSSILFWPSALSFSSLTIILISPLLEYQHLIWAIPAYLFLLLDFLEGRIKPRFFTISFALWILIFACRYWTDLALPLFMPPLHLSTWLVAILWTLTGFRIISLFAIDRTPPHRQD